MVPDSRFKIPLGRSSARLGWVHDRTCSALHSRFEDVDLASVFRTCVKRAGCSALGRRVIPGDSCAVSLCSRDYNMLPKNELHKSLQVNFGSEAVKVVG